jgi:hypothetical protein
MKIFNPNDDGVGKQKHRNLLWLNTTEKRYQCHSPDIQTLPSSGY